MKRANCDFDSNSNQTIKSIQNGLRMAKLEYSARVPSWAPYTIIGLLILEGE
jgi:hypothetical protein